MKKFFTAVSFSLWSLIALAGDGDYLIRHFTDHNNVIIGKVIVQVTRPEWTDKEWLDSLPKTGKNAESAYAIIQGRGYRLVYGINGRKVSGKSLCEIAIDSERIRYTNCSNLFPRVTT